MFGISLGKLLVLAALMLVVWYGFRLTGEIRMKHGARRRNRRPAEEKITTTLHPCPRCGAYLASGAACPCRNGS